MKKRLMLLVVFLLAICFSVKDVSAIVDNSDGRLEAYLASQTKLKRWYYPHSSDLEANPLAGLIDSDLYYGNYQFSMHRYRFGYVAAEEYNYDMVGYCLDPNAQGGDVAVKRLLLTNFGNFDDMEVSTFDVGLLTILINGYQGTEGRGLSAKEFEAATSIAVRSWVIGAWNYGRNEETQFYRNDSSNQQSNVSVAAFINQGAVWSSWDYENARIALFSKNNECRQSANGEELKQCMFNEASVSYSEVLSHVECNAEKCVTFWTDGNDSDGSANKIMNVSYELFKEGMYASRVYREYFEALNEQNEEHPEDFEVKSSSSSITSTSGEKQIRHEISMQNGNEASYVRLKSLICDDCEANGITLLNFKIQKKLDDGSYETLYPTTGQINSFDELKNKKLFDEETNSEIPADENGVRTLYITFDYQIENLNSDYDYILEKIKILKEERENLLDLKRNLYDDMYTPGISYDDMENIDKQIDEVWEKIYRIEDEIDKLNEQLENTESNSKCEDGAEYEINWTTYDGYDNNKNDELTELENKLKGLLEDTLNGKRGAILEVPTTSTVFRQRYAVLTLHSGLEYWSFDDDIDDGTPDDNEDDDKLEIPGKGTGKIICDKIPDEPEEVPCETKITEPVCMSECGIVRRNYYSIGYVFKQSEYPYSGSYNVALDIDPNEVSDVKVGSVTIFDSKNDYSTYINLKELKSIGDGNPSVLNVDQWFNSSLKTQNMDVNVTIQLSNNGDKYIATINYKIKNDEGVDAWSASDGNRMYIPLKISVYYDNGDCEYGSQDNISNDGLGKVEAPKDIKTCVLDKTDEAGNSYKLGTEDLVSSNPYCGVFCKEDYSQIAFNQGNDSMDNVICGRYFQLTAKIEGSKDCYTGGTTTSGNYDQSINKKQFIQDVTSAQTRMVSAYNAYTYWTAALSDIVSDEKKYSGEESYSCGTDEEPKTCCNTVYCIGYDTNAELEVEGYEITECNQNTGVCTMKDATITNSSYGDDGGADGESVEGADCETGCTDGSTETLKKNIQKKIDTAETEYKDAKDDYNNAISQYNDCTTGWTNEFQFNEDTPKVSWEYDQDYYETLKKHKDYETLKYLEGIDGTLIKDSEIMVCTGDINDEYECQSGINYISGNETSDYNKVMETFNFTYCDLDEGCYSQSKAISQARYVKKTEYAEQEYTTPTVYYQVYPSGKITVLEEKDNYIQTHALEHKLPIAPSTVGGGQYHLRLEDFGEFYETGALGRIFDVEIDDSHGDSSIGKVKNEKGEFDGKYTCNYYSPCVPSYTPGGPADCPECKYICEPNCEWVPCTSPDCKSICENCIFNQSELKLNVKTVSTTNFHSIDREYGYNWNINTTLPSLQLVRDKASLTIGAVDGESVTLEDGTVIENSESILAKNEQVYNSDEAKFSIRLTSSMIQEIREHNDSVQDVGGYANDSLTCYDYDEDNVNIFCYSDYIDYLMNRYPNDFTAAHRMSPDEDRSKTNESTGDNGYWTPWPNYKFDEDVIGGPAWK